MDSRQMELKLDRATCPRPLYRRGRRMSRSRWWFEQMRRAVEDARSWEAVRPVDYPAGGLSAGNIASGRR